MKKYIALVLICFFFGFVLAGCSQKYTASDMIGKTSSEIEEIYGEFDCVGVPRSDDGLYKNTFCGYTIREKRPSFWDSIPEKLFFILFDGNGIAHECYEGYRPGG